MTRERVLKLPVLEIFGPTFQGEGRAIGQKTMFVRTAGCDYHCDWCDSAFTWDGSEKPTRMTADEVIAALDKLGSYDYVTLSGGNPAILAANMAELVTKLKERGVTLAVETQGSRWQNWLKTSTRSPSVPNLLHPIWKSTLRPWTLSFPNWIQTRSPLKSLSLMMQIWPLPEAYKSATNQMFSSYQQEILSPRPQAILSKTN